MRATCVHVCTCPLRTRRWFNFKLCGVAGKRLTLRLLNAGGASYGPAWEGYRACASHDMQEWYRCASGGAGGEEDSPNSIGV